MKSRRLRLRTMNSAPGGPLSPRTTGFSLFEVVIVLVLIAIMASIGLSRFSASSRHQGLDAAARRLVADLEFARQTAVALGQPRTVTFVQNTATYTLDGRPDLNDPNRVYSVVLRAAPYEAAIQTLDLDGAGGTVLTFSGYGRPLVSAGATNPVLKVVLRGSNRSIDVGVDVATGRAYVGTTP